MLPKISVIIPVYNVEEYLARCVHSIINQSYKNLEIILINDGSTDDSGKLCDFFAVKDKRIKVIHQENRGLSGARNSGLKIATGEYIGFVDSDDWIEIEMYESMLNAMFKLKANIAECGIVETISSKFKTDRSGSIALVKRLDALKRIIEKQDFSVCRKLFHKQTIDNIYFIEGKNSEDVYFTIESFKNITNLVCLSNPYYNYFVFGDSITRGKYKLKTLDTIDAALYLKEKIYKEENDSELKEITKKFVLDVLLYNYKLLQQNSSFDKKLIHRKQIKKLIRENFIRNSNFQLRLAKILPIRLFNLVINLKGKFRKIE